MANMSYCRFENTYRDLKDCSLNMDEPGSSSEKMFRERLIKLCVQIADDYRDEIE